MTSTVREIRGNGIFPSVKRPLKGCEGWKCVAWHGWWNMGDLCVLEGCVPEWHI